MKVIVTGSRNWNYSHVDIIYRELSQFPEGTIIVHGGCTGVDEIAALISSELGFVVVEHKAEWEKYKVPGKKNPAGPIRNKKMLDEEKPDFVIAFHDDIENSSGTKDMVLRTIARRVKYKIVAN